MPHPITFLLLAALTLPAAAQAPYTPTLTFDVASIRQSLPPTSGSYMVGGGVNPTHNSEYTTSNNSIDNLLASAYGINHHQLANLPNWGRTMFTIQAKSDPATDEKLLQLSDHDARLEKQHMLQALLTDRFKLKTHWETKDLQSYDLVVAKNGPKLQPTPPPDPNRAPAQQHGTCSPKGCEFVERAADMDRFAANLTAQAHAAVANKTGLTAKYDFTLQFRGFQDEDPNPAPDAWPTLMQALPDQLGLKLLPTKTPTQILVIDHIEEPTDN